MQSEEFQPRVCRITVDRERSRVSVTLETTAKKKVVPVMLEAFDSLALALSWVSRFATLNTPNGMQFKFYEESLTEGEFNVN